MTCRYALKLASGAAADINLIAVLDKFAGISFNYVLCNAMHNAQTRKCTYYLLPSRRKYFRKICDNLFMLTFIMQINLMFYMKGKNVCVNK